MRILIAVLASALPLPAAAQSVSGPATVIDGDSLTVSGVEVRLVGIDAPEGRQTCDRGGQAWSCGEAATQQLRELVAGKQVYCRGEGTDAHGRLLAVCTAGRDELNKTLVELGFATAFRKYSDVYVATETRARQARSGIWGSTFVSPEDYRAANRPAEDAARAARPALARLQTRTSQRPATRASGCNIKGNHSRRGEWIYHMPGMPYYAQTRAEAVFCSEAEALAAGYRRSRAGGQ